jgi:hypothetical protein
MSDAERVFPVVATYRNDREFTDYAHNNIALPTIYDSLGWKPVVVDEDKAKQADMYFGIDYVFQSDGEVKTVQERFREKKYERYSDFTIRYRRDGNHNSDRRESEYYKIQADYFVYGITNCFKTDLTQCTSFLKYAVIDMKKIYEKLDSGEIEIRDNQENVCTIEKNTLVCPVKYNSDQSSSFFPIDIPLLVRLWEGQLIVKQHGYF